MVAWRYEFYFLVLKTIFYSLAALVRKMLFLPFESKIHVFAPPCNILYILLISALEIHRIIIVYSCFEKGCRNKA